MDISSGIPTWFIDQFSDTFLHQCQQMEKIVANLVRQEPISGENKSIDAISQLSLRKRSSRHQETTWSDPSTHRRWLDWETFDGDVMIDNQDKLSMLIDPQSDIMRELVYASNRKADKLVIDSAFATVTKGRDRGGSVTWSDTSFTGSNHSTAGLKIDDDVSVMGASGSSTGLTTDKLRIIRAIFAQRNVPENEQIYLAVNPDCLWNGLMKEEEYKNADYSVRKALAEGQIAPFAGITLVPTTLVSVQSSGMNSGADGYDCIAFTPGGLALGTAEGVNVRMKELPEHEFNIGVHLEMGMGAVRLDEDKVIKVECAQ